MSTQTTYNSEYGLDIVRPKVKYYEDVVLMFTHKEMRIADKWKKWVVIVEKMRGGYKVWYFENDRPDSDVVSSEDLKQRLKILVRNPAELENYNLPEKVKSALSWCFQKWEEETMRLKAFAMLRNVKILPRTTERDVFIHEVAKTLISKYNVARIKVKMRGNTLDLGFRCYDGRFWSPCEDMISSWISGELLEQQLMKTDQRFLEDVKARIEVINTKVLESYKPLLSFENGILDIEKFFETGNLMEAFNPPSRDLFAFHHIPHCLNIDLLKEVKRELRVDALPVKSEDILKLLRVLCTNAYQLLYDFTYFDGIDPAIHESRMLFVLEMIGRALIPGYRIANSVVPIFKNIFILLGRKDTGKSTFLRTFLGDTLLGENNYEITNLGKLCSKNSDEVEKELGKLSKKNPLIAIHPDLSKNTPVRDWSVVRQVSGGDPVTARLLYKDSFSYIPAWKIYIATNDPPKIGESGAAREALLSRFKILEVKNKTIQNKPFPTMDEKCLEAVILASLYSIYRVYRTGSWSFTGALDIEDVLNRYTFSEYNVVMEMISTGRLRLSPDLSITSAELYRECQCYVNEVKHLQEDDDLNHLYYLPDQSTFTKNLKRLLAKYGVRTVNHSNHTVFKGIGKAP